MKTLSVAVAAIGLVLAIVGAWKLAKLRPADYQEEYDGGQIPQLVTDQMTGIKFTVCGTACQLAAVLLQLLVSD